MTKNFLSQKIGIVIIVCAAFFMSCSKTETTDTGGIPGFDYYIKFKVNGVQKSYPFCGGQTVDLSSTFTGLTGATIAGAPLDHMETMGFNIYSLTPLANGNVFTGNDVNSSLELSQGVLQYVTDDGDHSYTSEETGATTPTVNIKLTEITATYFRGTFSGKMKEIDGVTKLTITDGEFYAFRQN